MREAAASSDSISAMFQVGDSRFPLFFGRPSFALQLQAIDLTYRSCERSILSELLPMSRNGDAIRIITAQEERDSLLFCHLEVSSF